ncbi:MAG: ATP-binding protein [Spirochaetota bacterium]
MKLKESETVELKKSTSELKEAIISIGAILNKHACGKIYFGVKDDGAVVGQSLGKDTLRDISKTISEHIEPKIYPEITSKKIAGKNCIVVEFAGSDKPYLSYGRAYSRMGTENNQLSRSELERLILKKHREESVWETRTSENTIDDINIKTVKNFIHKANLAGRINYKFDSVRNILKKLGLLRRNKLLKAAEVLFCKKNSLEVQVAVFAGTDKITFIDINKFKSNIFDLLDKSENYISEHINWGVRFGKLEREEIPEIPLKAVREALVNSLCHRDYTNPKGNEVAIFKDRVEIYNPGEFPEGYTPDDFIKGKERSILRNPLIAETIYKSKEIEKWGSGLKRIYDECLINKMPVEFKVLKSGFLVVFHRNLRLSYDKRVGVKKVKKWLVEKRVGMSTKKTTVRNPKNVIQIVRSKFGEKFGVSSEKILRIILQNKDISAQAIAEQIKLSSRAVEKQISNLKKLGILKRVGPDKGGYWQIIDKC